jgi:hypothetical protein
VTDGTRNRTKVGKWLHPSARDFEQMSVMDCRESGSPLSLAASVRSAYFDPQLRCQHKVPVTLLDQMKIVQDQVKIQRLTG